jgi:DNA mismatch endonuclease (patch repair protein)
MDHVSKEVRSKIMALVRSKDGRTTELKLARLLCAAGLRGYRKQWPVAGKPDLAWPGLKVAVFVDGCFWHGCLRHGRKPNSNRDYWLGKLRRNKQRDITVTRGLRKAGWRVLRLWAHALRKPQAIAKKISSQLSPCRNRCNHTPASNERPKR